MIDGWIILHGGALGDLALTLQLALRLPRVGQEGRVHVVSRTDFGELSACCPSITRQCADVLGLHWLYSENGAPRPAGLDELIRGAHVLSALGDARGRVHQRLLALEPARLYSFDPRPRPNLNRHITQQWATDLEAQGLLIPKCIHQHPGRRGLGVPNELRQRGAALLTAAGAAGRCVLIHPGSGGREKCWPWENFLAVGRALQRAGSEVCFVLGPVELERQEAANLRAVCDNFPVLHCPPPGDLVAALTAARALIGNDSGPAHLAALLGSPTITIFGPSSPVLWHPLGPEAVTITGDPQHHPADWNIDPIRVAAVCEA
ncbi:MAG: hypothetical protein KBH81_00750 [Phycisphaerae bacterium]|nr:hypothetical protein [Phycisphaerae bacterium]